MSTRPDGPGPGRVRLTRTGTTAAAVGVAGVAAGMLLGLAEITGLGLALIVLVGSSTLSLRSGRGGAGWRCTRELTSERTTVGRPLDVTVGVTRTGRGRGPRFELCDPVHTPDGSVSTIRRPITSLASGRSDDASYRIRIDRRGVATIGPMRIEVLDPFGLARRSTRCLGEVRATVLPKIDVIAAPEFPAAADADQSPTSSTRTGPEFSSLRDYVPGDDLRKVHWRSSARRDELAVRHDVQPRRSGCTVLIDTRSDIGDPGAFEQLVSAAASIIAAASRTGRPFRLCSTGGFDSDRGSGPRHTDLLLGTLATIDTTPAVIPAMRHSTDPLVVLTTVQGLGSIRAHADPTGPVALVVAFGDTTGDDPTRADDPHVLRISEPDTFADRWNHEVGAHAPTRAPSVFDRTGPRMRVGSDPR